MCLSSSFSSSLPAAMFLSRSSFLNQVATLARARLERRKPELGFIQSRLGFGSFWVITST